MPRPFRSRLAFKLALGILAAALVPLVGSAWLTIRLAEARVLDDASQRQHEVCAHVESLVTVWIERTQQELESISMLLSRDLAQRNAGTYYGANDVYRETVDQRLMPIVQGPSPFLELQVFSNDEAPDLSSNILVANYQQVEWNRLNPQVTEVEGQPAEQILSRAGSPVVNRPLETGKPWHESALQQTGQVTSRAVGVPLDDQAATRGVLVADVDFGELAALVTAVAGQQYSLRVEDPRGTLLVDTGEFDGEQLSRSLAFSDGEWRVTVAEPAERVLAPLEELRRQAFLWCGLAILLAATGSWLLSTRISRPVGRLEQAAEAMARGSLETRSGLRGADEIGRLGAAFDRMAAALQELDRAKSDFVANASHELRTPLTGMRMSVANLLDGLVGELAPDQRTALDRVRRDVDRMIRLVEDLLALARLDAGVEPVRPETVDLHTLAREACEGLETTAAARNVGLVVEGVGRAWGDPALLRRMLANLLDNAVQNSPPGGKVRTLVADGSLVVRDEGSGLPDGPLFERFRRGAPEREERPGFGLGLALVRQLVELQGGSVTGRNESGAVLEVILPTVGEGSV